MEAACWAPARVSDSEPDVGPEDLHFQHVFRRRGSCWYSLRTTVLRAPGVAAGDAEQAVWPWPPPSHPRTRIWNRAALLFPVVWARLAFVLYRRLTAYTLFGETTEGTTVSPYHLVTGSCFSFPCSTLVTPCWGCGEVGKQSLGDELCHRQEKGLWLTLLPT